jgi:hypothetical protein
MEESEKVPGWLTTGITYFLPNLGDNKAVKITNILRAYYKPCTNPNKNNQKIFEKDSRTKTYYQQSKNDVNLEVTVTRISYCYRQQYMTNVRDGT